MKRPKQLRIELLGQRRRARCNRKANYEGLLDVVQRSGMAVLWLDNQSGCKGACDRKDAPVPWEVIVPLGRTPY